jgi:hypothetical protein
MTVIIGIILFHYLFSNDSDDETITIYTCGGLGNQLFQICFGYSLSRQNNLRLSIIPSRDNVHKVDNSKYFRSIFKHFQVQKNTYDDNYYLEPVDKYNSYIPDLFAQKCTKSKTFAGYFQTEKYFIHYKDELISIFTDNDVYQSVYNLNRNNKSYFIHIRRGDYLSSSSLYINLDKYYENAINYVLKIDRKAHFYIISDDIDYCKSYHVFQDINKTFYENQDELETLYFMSLCKKGGICCNSTFSWFGSYFNTNPGKIVIFPDKWDNELGGNDIYYTNSIILPTH